MKRTLLGAILATLLLNSPALASGIVLNTGEIMGETKEGDILIFDSVALDMDVTAYPADFGRIWGFRYILFDRITRKGRTVDALVNDKSCANGRYFLFNRDGSLRKIQTESRATKKMLTKACNTLREVYRNAHD